MKINEKNDLRFLMDSGASVNVMSIDTLRSVLNERNPVLKKSNTRLRTYNNSIVLPIGKKMLRCSRRNTNENVEFEIVK